MLNDKPEPLFRKFATKIMEHNRCNRNDTKVCKGILRLPAELFRKTHKEEASVVSMAPKNQPAFTRMLVAKIECDKLGIHSRVGIPISRKPDQQHHQQRGQLARSLSFPPFHAPPKSSHQMVILANSDAHHHHHHNNNSTPKNTKEENKENQPK